MEQFLKLWNKFRDYVTIGLAAVVVVTSIGWYVTDLKLDKEVSLRAADKATYEKAQADYTVQAEKDKAEIEKKGMERAQEANTNYSNLRRKYDAILVRLKTSRSSDSNSYLPSASGTTGSSQGASEGSELSEGFLIIPFEDAEICAENTAKAQVFYEWAKTYGDK